jgi:hypothetical protein
MKVSDKGMVLLGLLLTCLQNELKRSTRSVRVVLE